MLAKDVQTMERSHLFDFDILESDEWLDGPDLTDSLQAQNPTLSRLNCVARAYAHVYTCQDVENVLSTRVTAVNIVGCIVTIENLV